MALLVAVKKKKKRLGPTVGIPDAPLSQTDYWRPNQTQAQSARRFVGVRLFVRIWHRAPFKSGASARSAVSGGSKERSQTSQAQFQRHCRPARKTSVPVRQRLAQEASGAQGQGSPAGPQVPASDNGVLRAGAAPRARGAMGILHPQTQRRCWDLFSRAEYTREDGALRYSR